MPELFILFLGVTICSCPTCKLTCLREASGVLLCLLQMSHWLLFYYVWYILLIVKSAPQKFHYYSNSTEDQHETQPLGCQTISTKVKTSVNTNILITVNSKDLLLLLINTPPQLVIIYHYILPCFQHPQKCFEIIQNFYKVSIEICIISS
jgi:hypothetical protein